MLATERGYGKRTALAEFPIKGRGIQGVIGIKCSDRNGPLIRALRVHEDDEVMLISGHGTLVRTRVAEISQLGRNTQGVTLIRLPDDEKLIGVVRLDASEEEEELEEGELKEGEAGEQIEHGESQDEDATDQADDVSGAATDDADE